jgi:hypothetical protein
MRPISFESAAEMQCLSDYVKSSQWNLNFNYWTGGLKQNDTWWWCPEEATRLSSGVIWTKGQPDNKNSDESCLHMCINKTTKTVELSDRSCSNQFVLGCKVYSFSWIYSENFQSLKDKGPLWCQPGGKMQMQNPMQ